ncbi:ACS family hexuronate transporter-like MFS transporter [Sphingopyxis italica]|uniref:ACS family hexuronate transporter-like MFS transporter n=1 Tax=Sphingopyxis italica TaxID=1129133 RepID=A0A7X6B9A9_9SPHN|nr:MFS transporter [Sphingopyxis italica]NJB89298.1 ACS family hexuronate transporter-like MFS transporter [Sphingopyxis italica]
MAQAFADGGTATPVPRTGRYRWLIVGVLFAATTVNYIDRTMLGLLAPTLGDELKWTENDYGNIVTAFQFAYALGFLLMGWLIDRFGPKIGYAIAISIWTVGHVAHGFASSVVSFMLARVILGVGEAGHFPSVVRASSEWFPQKERSYAIGWVNSATTIGVILTAPTVALCMRVLGFDWRETFIYTGAFGVLLLILWLWLYSNPRESGKVSEAELAWIEHDPPEKIERIGWGKIVTKREAWAFAMAKFLTDPVWFLMLFWLPKYFSTTYNVDLKIILLPMIIMYLLSDAGSILGGWVSSKLIQTGHSVNFARKVTMIGAGLCVLPLLFVTGLENMWLAVVLIGIALAGHQAFSSTILSIPPDMFPKRAVGSVIGLGGFMGGVGGMIMAKSTGLVLDATGGNYTLIFAACTIVYFLAVLAVHLLSPRLAPVGVESAK